MMVTLFFGGWTLPFAGLNQPAGTIAQGLAHIGIFLAKVFVFLVVIIFRPEGLLGKTAGITRLRGQWQEFRAVPVMPTYHPAYLLRNVALSEKRKVWEDMLQVLERLGRPISEKQRNYFLNV